MTAPAETFEFQTEARQLLDLMIHSVYSNKDIFLRELISNSSDAMDKRRFEAVKHPALAAEGEMVIRLEADREARALSIADMGIGMSRQEVIDLIGTIAKSGTKEFLARLKESKEQELSTELIGQFGVGFYSCFMVADEVTMVTRRAGEDTATRWHSSGDGTYTLEETERDEPGTTVTLHLKDQDSEDGLHDYTQEWQIREIVKRYSDFVAYPIQMDIERTEVERDDEGKPVEGGEEKTVVTTETLNSMKAIWLRDKSEVTDEEYNEFYKHISHDWNEPLERIQAKIEGTLEYRLLLYIPGSAPFDLFHAGGQQHGVHLYVKRVFIMDECQELLPDYLRFIKGVVDSEDLSLNISREMLQQDRQIQRMRRGIVSKVIDAVKALRNRDEEKFGKFWTEFGRVFKEGLFQDHDNKETILDLARFKSTNDAEELTTLQAYVDRMPPSQEEIYFLTGANRRQIESSPHLEAFKEKGYEVLILDDPVDEVWTQGEFTFADKKIVSASRGAVELGSEEEKKEAEETRKEQQKTYASLLECLKQALEQYVKEVRLSSRLTTSAACLVSDAGDLTPQLEQMLKKLGQDMPATKRVLELNPKHPIVEKLQALYDADKDNAELPDYAHLLYGQAVLAESGQLPDPTQFSKLVSQLMVKSM